MTASFTQPIPLKTKPAPQPGKLFLDALTVDPDVQRTVDPSWVTRKLSEGFRRDGLGTVTVSHRRDGSYHIIDGQHRVALCREFGYKQPLDCLIHSNLTKAEEALMFLVLNDRRGVQPIDKFKVGVYQGDDDIVALNDLLVRYGWTVRNGKTAGSFAAVSALRKIYVGWGRVPVKKLGVVESTISTITTAWDRDANSAHTAIITGLGLIFAKHGNTVRIDKLVDGLKAEGNPKALVSRARSLHVMTRGRAGDAMAEIMINLHNDRCRGPKYKLPRWMGDSE